MNNIDVVKGFSNDNVEFTTNLNIVLNEATPQYLNLQEISSEVTITVKAGVCAKLYLTLNYNDSANYKINVERDANFEMVCIQNSNNENSFNSRVDLNAEYNMFLISLCEKSKNTFETDLVNDYAKYNLKTAAINLSGYESEISINTKHLHKATESDAVSRSVILSDAKYINSTIGFIEKGCSFSKCHQDTKAIVLGENAIAECDPVLLIDEYDVEASHAAAVGQINEEDLYYMQSRGLSYAQCLALLVNGFLISVTDQISDQDVKDYLATQISEILSV